MCYLINRLLCSELAETSRLIGNETTTHRDIIIDETIHDTYRSLPAILKSAYKWAAHNLPHTLWFVKADDDIYLFVSKLVVNVPPAGPFYFHSSRHPFKIYNEANMTLHGLKCWISMQ